MKISINQPTFLPWLGYFSNIYRVDKFVFLDDVSFSGSWQNKNKILTKNKVININVPVKRSKKNLNEIDIFNYKFFKKKNIQTIKTVYGRAPYFDDIKVFLDFYENLESDKLSQLNINIINFFLKKIGIHTEVLSSSKMNFNTKRSIKLIDIINYLQADKYQCSINSKKYMEEDNFFDLCKCDVIFYKYEVIKYNQFNSNTFVKNLSIIDAIANIGYKNIKKVL